MEHTERARRASSFGAEAGAYAEHRPDYPAAAITWGLDPVAGRPDLRVLDLGAGTGKLTDGLLDLGLDVIAVEPDPAMLAELTARHPGVEAHRGSAERIPLPGASVDAVLVGQALHWFDLDRALPDINRVLRPGGVLVALWNTHDDRVDWVAGYCRVAGTVAYTTAVRRVTAFEAALDSSSPPLGAWANAEFPHRQRRTADTLVRTAATQSDTLVLGEGDRAERLGRVRAYLDDTVETAHGEFDLPLVTRVTRVTLA